MWVLAVQMPQVVVVFVIVVVIVFVGGGGLFIYLFIFNTTGFRAGKSLSVSLFNKT